MLRVLIAILALLAGALGVLSCRAISMPGESYAGPLPAARGTELEARLRRHVDVLASEIGTRNFDFDAALERAAQYVEAQLRAQGHAPRALPFDVLDGQVRNIAVEIPGGSAPEEIVVVGAHYDSVSGSPGADDNASGVAVLVELARRFQSARPQRTLRFVAFANEEPPFFRTEQMGSLVYARESAARGERIVGMLSIESVGFYTDAPGSQQHPPPAGLFYPDQGNFIAFIGNSASRALLHDAIAAFRGQAKLPSEGLAAPGFMQAAGLSDHWSFWQSGYPALMVTDTAPFRNPGYHRQSDTPDTLDYAAMAELVGGLEAAVAALVGDAGPEKR